MTPSVTNNQSSESFYFDWFESRQDFFTKGEQAIANTNSGMANARWQNRTPRTDFEGSDDIDLLSSGNFGDYIDRNALEESFRAFDEVFAKIDMGGAFEKHRLKTTSDPRGMFDFGLASKGLYRVPEYYSAELAKDHPFLFLPLPSGVVRPELVDKDKLNQYWYTHSSGKKYLLERRQEGTTEIMAIASGAVLREDSEGMIYCEPAKYGEVALKFASSIKKSYIMFERKRGKARMVDLYVDVAVTSEYTYEGMLEKTLPMLLAARFFEMAGIRTRINAVQLLRLRTDYGGYSLYAFPVKNFGEDLDFNYLGINLSDPRSFRWNYGRYQNYMDFQNNNLDYYWGNQTTVNDTLTQLELGNRYKNWYFDKMQKGELPQIPLDRNLMIFGGVGSPTNDLSSQASRDAVRTEFYRIIDTVDYQFNDAVKASQRIYKRMVEDENKSVDQFKRYAQKTLSEAYSYPSRGQYATEPERRDEMDLEYEQKIEGLNNYLLGLQ